MYLVCTSVSSFIRLGVRDLESLQIWDRIFYLFKKYLSIPIWIKQCAGCCVRKTMDGIGLDAWGNVQTTERVEYSSLKRWNYKIRDTKASKHLRMEQRAEVIFAPRLFVNCLRHLLLIGQDIFQFSSCDMPLVPSCLLNCCHRSLGRF